MKKLTLVIALSISALITGQAHAGLFSSTSYKQETNISCYDNLNVKANVGQGGTFMLQTGNCNIESMQVMGGIGKFGDILQIRDLPQAINLGSIAQGIIKTKDNIPNPQAGQKTLISFVPTEGQIARTPIQFLIEHVSADQLDKQLEERGLTSAANELRTQNPGQKIELFVYYRQLPILTGQNWFDLGQTLMVAGSVQPQFNVAIDASGKLMLSSDETGDATLFDLGQFEYKKADRSTNITEYIKQAFAPLLQYKQLQMFNKAKI